MTQGDSDRDAEGVCTGESEQQIKKDRREKKDLGRETERESQTLAE